jgi:predicted flavoprotein YhiN
MPAAPPHFDAVILGAGAAGLFCAGIAGQRGLRVLVIDHAEKLAEKIRISGGGRCNFTNRDTTPAQVPVGQPALLPVGAGALHAGRFHRPGAAPRHRLP